jgi:hypothetical protein
MRQARLQRESTTLTPMERVLLLAPPSTKVAQKCAIMRHIKWKNGAQVAHAGLSTPRKPLPRLASE